jgi:hypothetical protein
VNHLFFKCCVANELWRIISEVTGIQVGTDFESVAKHWLDDRKFRVLNTCTSAVLWALWKIRDGMCFQGLQRSRMKLVLGRCARMLMNWKLLLKEEEAAKLEGWAANLEDQSRRPQPLDWHPVPVPDPETCNVPDVS